MSSIGTLAPIDGSPESQVDSDTGGSSDWTALSAGGLRFPILSNPTSLVGMLFGKNVDLVTWTLPFASLDIPFPDFPLAYAQIAFFYVEADLFGNFGITLGGNTLGFDTRGLKTGNFSNGFYFLNQPVLSLNAGIGIEAGAGIGIGGVIGARVDLGGELQGQINAGFADPSGSSKIYFDELQSTCALQQSASLGLDAIVARITEDYVIGSSTQEFVIAPTLPLFSYSTSCTRKRWPISAQARVRMPALRPGR